MTADTNETKYYLLSWLNITDSESDSIGGLPDYEERWSVIVNDYFNNKLPSTIEKAMQKLTVAGAEPKFISNEYAIAIAFRTKDPSLADEFRQDPHDFLLDSDETLYQDPDGHFERMVREAEAKNAFVVPARTITQHQLG